MWVTINGEPAEVGDGTTVEDVVGGLAGGGRHVAVALNGAVVPRGAWPATRLAAGDSVEVLAPVAGG